MASVTKGKDEDQAASKDDPSETPLAKSQRNEGNDVEDENDLAGEEESDDKGAAKPGKKGPIESRKPQKRRTGFFTIYKSGQGYWTRMGTAMGSGLLALMLAYTIYDKLPSFFPNDAPFGKKVGLEVAAGFLVLFGGIAWWMMNKPANVDFLIATDSEMKKVNWTSRKELMGSTRVVILFMFGIAFFLFAVDEVWGWLMFVAKVLKIPPPPFG
jgi:preprotein translocase SecE subunit